jgi:HEAT repeat protein
MNALLLASLAITVANVLLIGMLVGRRLLVHRREVRRHRAEIYLGPFVLRFLDAGTGFPPDLTAAQRAVLADMLVAYARTVRGPARTRITGYLEGQGAAARELAGLRARKAWRRAEAAHRLGDIGSLAAVPVLIAALDDPSRDVRAAAARSLGHLHSPDTAAPLLAAMSGQRIPAVIGSWALLQFGEAILPQLHHFVRSPEPAERACAVQLLGLSGGAADAGAVAARLRDTSSQVRVQAAVALGRLGGHASVAPLLGALDDWDPAVRSAAATALGRLADPRAVGPLRSHAQHDRFEPARAAAAALLKIDPRLVIAERSSGGPHLREAADAAALQ